MRHTMPEKGRDHADDDGESREVEPEGRARGDGEVDVEFGADCTVEDQGDGVNGITKDQTVDSLAPVVEVSH